MRSRSVAVAIGLSAFCAVAAAGAFFQVHRLRTEADWLLERGSAQAKEYAATFDGAFADSQLDTFEQRRAVLDRAQAWQSFEYVLILAAVVLAFSSYVFWLFKRLNDQLLTDGGEHVAIAQANAQLAQQAAKADGSAHAVVL